MAQKSISGELEDLAISMDVRPPVKLKIVVSNLLVVLQNMNCEIMSLSRRIEELERSQRG